MSNDLLKIGGIIQTLFGAAGQFIPGAGEVLTTQSTNGNIFNMVSGVLLGAAGFQKSEKTAKVVGPVVGIVNAAAGVLGLTGNSTVAGFQLNSGTPQIVLNFIIAAIGILTPFLKKKK
ncbi:MAG: hypothetical protein A2Y69_10830 [Candidatus Aminicenantes bacterium RBG_13_59_9]|nr:MAG: hypothetical protein A2Y69_10830 [Candidatus Aminicenantes bacterium RBG_13_59_9]